MINKKKTMLKSSQPNSIVFYGPSWSSKTKLWNILFMNKKVESITSMEIKEGFVNNEQKEI
jgi:replication-associated recombination protein RarA